MGKRFKIHGDNSTNQSQEKINNDKVFSNKSDMYIIAYMKLLNSVKQNKKTVKTMNDYKDYIKKLVFYGVKYINYYHDENPEKIGTKRYLSKERTEAEYEFIDGIIYLLGLMTPGDIVQLFPPDKVYDGAKYFEKDYFTTMSEVNKYNADQILGKENVKNLLWDYKQHDLFKFQLNWMTVVDDMCKCNGEKGLAGFFEDAGLTTFSMNDDFMVNNVTGEIIPLEKSNLRIIEPDD